MEDKLLPLYEESIKTSRFVAALITMIYLTVCINCVYFGKLCMKTVGILTLSFRNLIRRITGSSYLAFTRCLPTLKPNSSH